MAVAVPLMDRRQCSGLATAEVPYSAGTVTPVGALLSHTVHKRHS
jgi:hypothetical protein